MNPDLAAALQEHMGLCMDLATSCEGTEETAIAAKAIREATMRLGGLFEAINTTGPRTDRS